MRNQNPLRLPALLLALGFCYVCGAAAEEQTEGFHCVITPSQTVELGSPVPGQLREVLVDRSDKVTQGQIVASLDSRLQAANLEIARLCAQADTEVRLRKAAFAIDRRTEKRLSSLQAAKVASAQERDRAARLSAWRMRQAEDDQELYALGLARAEAALDRRKIGSPIDGTVVARLHNPGEYVEDQALLRIVNLDPLYVEAILLMDLFGRVKAGMQAQVFPELQGGGEHLATAELVDPMGDAGSGTFGARLSLSDPGHTIPAGLKCRVRLETAGPIVSGVQGSHKDSPRLAAAKAGGR